MMELGEAKALVANMKAKYAQYARLEEAIAAVEQATGLMTEREAALQQVEQSIAERTAEQSELTNQVNLLKDKLSEAELAYAKRTRAMDDDYQTRRIDIANGVKHAEREAELDKSKLRDEVVALEMERDHLREQIDGLKRQIATIRQSLNISGT